MSNLSIRAKLSASSATAAFFVCVMTNSAHAQNSIPIVIARAPLSDTNCNYDAVPAQTTVPPCTVEGTRDVTLTGTTRAALNGTQDRIVSTYDVVFDGQLALDGLPIATGSGAIFPGQRDYSVFFDPENIPVVQLSSSFSGNFITVVPNSVATPNQDVERAFLFNHNNFQNAVQSIAVNHRGEFAPSDPTGDGYDFTLRSVDPTNIVNGNSVDLTGNFRSNQDAHSIQFGRLTGTATLTNGPAFTPYAPGLGATNSGVLSPYALDYAVAAEVTTQLDENGLITPTVSVTDGINMNGSRISNMADGVDPGDAVTVSQLNGVSDILTVVNDRAVNANLIAQDAQQLAYQALANSGTCSIVGTGLGSGLHCGTSASASGLFSTALGSNANSSASNSVALGALSLADQSNTVSIGNANLQRRITNVAAGISPTDAVNLDQLNQALAQQTSGIIATSPNPSAASVAFSGNGNLAVGSSARAGSRVSHPSYDDTAVGSNSSAEGGGSTALGAYSTGSGIDSTSVGKYSTASGNFSAALGSSANASGSTAVAIGSGATASNSSTVAIGWRAQATGAGSTAFGNRSEALAESSVAIGFGSTASRANTASFGSLGFTRQLTDISAGTELTDAVNLQQLNGVANAAAAAQTTANTALINAATAQTTANTALTRANNAQTTANTALTNAATAQTTANTALTNAAGAQTTADTALTNAATAQATANQALAQTGQALTGLTTLTGDVTTALNTANSAQGAAANAQTAANAAQGTANTALTNAATAQTTANTAITNAAAAQTTANTAITNAATAQTTADTALVRADQALTGIANATTNSQNAVTAANEALSRVAFVQVNGSGTGPVAGGANAVAVGSNSNAATANSVAIGNGATANGGAAVSIGLGNTATGNGAVAIGDPNVATGTGAVAMGADNTATGDGAVAIGNLSVANGAGNVALGNGARANAANTVALGGGSVANQANTVSVGAAGAERRVVNVAAGTASTDAANVGQVNAAVLTESQVRAQQMLQINQRIAIEETARATLGTALQNETNARLAGDMGLSVRIDGLTTRLDQIDSRLEGLEDNIATSGAVATAMGGGMFLPDMKFNLTANVATYEGAHAGAMQFGTLLSPNVAVNVGAAISFNKKSTTAARVGFTVGW